MERRRRRHREGVQGRKMEKWQMEEERHLRLLYRDKNTQSRRR